MLYSPSVGSRLRCAAREPLHFKERLPCGPELSVPLSVQARHPAQLREFVVLDGGAAGERMRLRSASRAELGRGRGLAACMIPIMAADPDEQTRPRGQREARPSADSTGI